MPPFLFQFHGIHGSTNAVLSLNLVNGKDPFGIIQDPFSQGSLAGIDVGADPYVSQFF